MKIMPKFLLFAWMFYFYACSAEISRKELRSKHENDTQSDNVSKSSRIDPSRVVQLSWQPRVFVYTGFLSDEECSHLISLASGETDSVVRNTDGINARSLAELGVKDEIVERIEEKISAWTLLPLGNSRPLQIQRYAGENASQKYDFYGNKLTWEASEPLMATVVLCLSNPSQGGEISFPDSQVKPSRESRIKTKLWPYSPTQNNFLKPIKGNTILFFHVHPNSSPDKSSHHERNPVTDGEMWSAVKVFHLRPVNKVKIQSEPENSDCTDEDESCSQWASLGECERNPVFMVGSPDYYGTCRKSCKVC